MRKKFILLIFYKDNFPYFDLVRTSPKKVHMFGEKIKELREANGLMQREVAAELEVDTAYVSKIEKNEKPASRQHIKKLSTLLHCAEDELLTLWLAEKLYDLVREEKTALESMQVALKEIKLHKQIKK